MNYSYYAVVIHWDTDRQYAIHARREEADAVFLSWITGGEFATVAEEQPNAYLAIYRIDTSEPRPWEVDQTWSAWDHIDAGKCVALYSID